MFLGAVGLPMLSVHGWTRFVISVSAFLILMPMSAIEAQEPASAAEALAVSDLSKLPRIKATGDVMSESASTLSYMAAGEVKPIAEGAQKVLVKEGWKELEGAMVTESYASATYQKKGFSLSLTVTPLGEPGNVLVAMTNHGNVDLKTLPLPKGLKEVYAMPAMVMYSSNTKVEALKEQVRSQLKSAGWENFGDTTVSFFVKKNAVLLQVMIGEAPAMPGQTSIQISSQLMSIDLPVPKDVSSLQYSDSPPMLYFQSPKSVAHWETFFRDELSKLGWTATTENLFKIDFTEHLIFRNESKAMIEIEFRSTDDGATVKLKYTTAEKAAEEDRRAKEAAEKAKAAREKGMNSKGQGEKITFTLPKGLTIESKTENSVEVAAKSGAAQKLIGSWLKQLQEAGWKLESVVDTKEVAEHRLTKEGVEVNVSVVDPGFIPARISISTSNETSLEVKASK